MMKRLSIVNRIAVNGKFLKFLEILLKLKRKEKFLFCIKVCKEKSIKIDLMKQAPIERQNE